jgi:2-dehydropantoate 2-reductase
MQIIVVGAGAIGSLFGAKLAAANDVILVGRADHVAAITASGLRIEGLEPQVVRVRAATNVQEVGPGTLILLTTKVPDTPAALEPLAGLVRDDTTIVSLQNGLGSEVVARSAIHDRCIVLRAITQAGAIFERAGVIRYMIRGNTLLEQHDRSQPIAEVLSAAGLDCRVSPNINTEIWQKLVFNCVLNPITAIVGREVGAIADSRLDPLKQLVIEECVAVAAAEGVTLLADFIATINEVFGQSRNIVSMQQDLLRGRPTEIDYMNGAVATLGAKHGLECPVNCALTAIIKRMELQSRSQVPKEMIQS